MSEKRESIEESIARLEAIVRELEGGRLPLDQAVARFEEGLGLVRSCRGRLSEAEAKIHQLMADGSEAEIVLESGQRL